MIEIRDRFRPSKIAHPKTETTNHVKLLRPMKLRSTSFQEAPATQKAMKVHFRFLLNLELDPFTVRKKTLQRAPISKLPNQKTERSEWRKMKTGRSAKDTHIADTPRGLGCLFDVVLDSRYPNGKLRMAKSCRRKEGISTAKR